MHDDPTRMMGQPGDPEGRPGGDSLRLLVAGMLAVIVGLAIAILVIAGGDDGDAGTSAPTEATSPPTATEETTTESETTTTDETTAPEEEEAEEGEGEEAEAEEGEAEEPEDGSGGLEAP